MATPTKATVNASTDSNLTDITDAANAEFITQTDACIANAVAQGLYRVNVTSLLNVDLGYIQSYYVALGYKIVFPNDVFVQPAQLFGPNFAEFFQSPNTTGLKNPTEIILSWL